MKHDVWRDESIRGGSMEQICHTSSTKATLISWSAHHAIPPKHSRRTFLSRNSLEHFELWSILVKTTQRNFLYRDTCRMYGVRRRFGHDKRILRIKNSEYDNILCRMRNTVSTQYFSHHEFLGTQRFTRDHSEILICTTIVSTYIEKLP